MPVWGNTFEGDTPAEVGENRKWVTQAVYKIPARIVKLTAKIDGLGSGTLDQELRAVIYDEGFMLVAESQEVVVSPGAPADFVDFLFTHLPLGGVTVGPGLYFHGLHGGPNATARIWANAV